jgi:hypothetical protein
MSVKREEEVMDESAVMDFTINELREFLEADLLDVPVDPEFKERLRKKLWEMVQANANRRMRRKDAV